MTVPDTQFESRRLAPGEYVVRTAIGTFRVTKQFFGNGRRDFSWVVEGDTVTEDVDLASADAAFGWIRMHTALRLANIPEMSPTQRAIFDFVQDQASSLVKVTAVTGFSLVHEEHERGFYPGDDEMTCEPGRTAILIGFRGVWARRVPSAEIGDPYPDSTIEVSGEDLASVANLLNSLMVLPGTDAR